MRRRDKIYNIVYAREKEGEFVITNQLYNFY